jgi:YD repeat-containing protein
MLSEHTINEDLVRRLPLPLAQLYRRAHNAHGAQNRHQAAYFLWEAALKLLGCAAVAEYAARGQTDPALAERLTNLARPSVGHWWEFVRLLVPALAETGDQSFAKVRDLLLGRGRDDLPRAAGLDAALREALDGAAGARSTVRLSELFERLVRYRNRELGHGALGLRPAEFYERMGGALLAGVSELLSWLDVLAGRRLLYVGEVRQSGGVWTAQRHELSGEAARSVAPLEVPRDQAGRLPDGDRLYLEGPDSVSRPLFPLLLHDAETMEVLFLNSRRGQQRTEYLSYATGRTVERKDLAGAQQSLLSQVLGLPVDQGRVREWVERAESEEEKVTPADGEPAGTARRRVGEFEVFSELGRGGMGIVYRAWQPSLGRQVALKKLLRAGDPRTEARFLREIKALGRVEHPNLVKVFTSGSDGEDWFYAMELIEGADLAGVCEHLARGAGPTLGDADWQRAVTTACDEARRRERPLSDDGRPPAPHAAPPSATPPPLAAGRGQEYVTRVAEVIWQAAEAAHALHEAGVVHRDIKPGNILVTPDGTHAVLMDLGLAQLADEMDRKLTRTREFLGTLRYASPEQVLAVAPVDRRSDVYSLGASLWELLTLRPLYGATDQTPSAELMQRIQSREPESVRSHNPRVPRDLDAIVLRCLEKDASRRYATARELADDLGRFLRHEPVQARPIGPVQRLLRRVRRRPAAAVAILLFALAVPALLGAGYWWWDTHERVRVEYFANYSYRSELPVGIGRLTAEEVRHHTRAWRFRFRGKQVESVELVNGSGRCPTLGQLMGAAIERADTPARTCRLEFVPKERGGLERVVARDRAGNVEWTFFYMTPTSGFFADEDGIPRARGGTGAAHLKIALTPQGFRESIWYLDKDGKPQVNGRGAFCEQMEFDERGLPVRVRTLAADGRPVRNRDGYAEATARYDGQGYEVEAAYFDEAGRPTRHKDGYARLTAQYDEHGNAVAVVYLDEAGRPTRVSEGFAEIRMKYDDRGNQVEAAYLDEAGRLTLSSSGVARWTAKYDEHGNQVEQAYFDEAGRPTPGNFGAARVVMKYDERDRRVERAYFDDTGRPTRHVQGASVWKTTYDEQDRAVEEASFDEAGRPVRNKEGVARVTKQYDKRGNRVEEAYFDEAGRPTRCKERFARLTAQYDERGNMVEQAYFDEAGRPTRHQDGTVVWRLKYDDRGNRIEESYLDAAGRPTWIKLGYVTLAAKYDDRGNRIEAVYLDAAGRPTRNKDGVARLASRFDARDHHTEWAYFDEAGRSTWHTAGNAVWRRRYDDRGRVVEESFLDEAGKPVRVAQGCARITRKYDDRGHQIETAYFDEAGRPVNQEAGFARRTARFDERGNEVEVAFFDAAGQPTRSDQGVARWEAKYDARGNLTERAYFDEAGRPTRHPYGNAIWRLTYDARDNRAEEAYFDERGQPVRALPGYARAVRRHDERDNLVEESFFDEQGHPTAGNQGYARLTAQYDDRDNWVELSYFDVAGRPVRNVNGNEVDAAYLDEADRPMVSKRGYARRVSRYDDQGYLVERSFLDAGGNPLRAEVVVKAVQPGGRAARLGLLVGDVLLTYAGQPVTEALVFTSQRRRETVGDRPRELNVLRGDKRVAFSLVPGPLEFGLDDRVPAGR